jgi:glutaredoxin
LSLTGYELDLPTNELDKVDMPKVEGVTVKDLFTAKELEQIFAAAYETRNRAIVRVLYESAARASELLSMKIEDVRFNEDKTAHITVTGKTGVRELLLYRSVPSLKAWIEAHPTGEGSVWVTLKGELSTLSYTGLFQVVKKIISRAGLKKRKTCHMFRHSRLTELVKLGIRGEHLRKFAGWRPGSMMESVYIHLSQVDVERELWSKAYGLEDNGTFEPMMTLRECPHCKENNDTLARVCMSCGRRMNESTSELETLKGRLANLEDLIEQVANSKISQEWIQAEVYEEPPKEEQERIQKELEEQIEAEEAR